MSDQPTPRHPNMTLVDAQGASLTFERDTDCVIAVWIAIPGEADGYSYLLDSKQQNAVIQYLTSWGAA